MVNNFGHNNVILSRAWCMPNKQTFQMKPIKQLINRYIENHYITVNPFANNSKIGITNDLNPVYSTDHNLCASIFLEMFDPGTVDCVLFDPPYSLRQLKECYDNCGHAITHHDTKHFYSDIKDQIASQLKIGGICLSFGWNSTGIGKNRGLKIIEVLLVCHGGNHHDTICVVEKKYITKGIQYELW
tara:strand:- start:1023 stop:1580 length:558 start_codon:yes stop_codon:yes gene_type:complete